MFSQIINIGRFEVGSMTNNANINFGPVYQNSHTANSIVVGSCFSVGDFSSCRCIQINPITKISTKRKE
ncbi:spore germination protein [Falsibacillus pallidus]|uniref:spore germination protein n=1 Tax=Falsibacillus pallidus TaxID=493781 RepID=UPI000E0BE581|nr:spore germination protein [Falsibacillus pallidus]